MWKRVFGVMAIALMVFCLIGCGGSKVDKLLDDLENQLNNVSDLTNSDDVSMEGMAKIMARVQKWENDVTKIVGELSDHEQDMSEEQLARCNELLLRFATEVQKIGRYSNK